MEVSTLSHLDAVDQGLVEGRLAKMRDNPQPQVGDWVRFADGTERRISYHWTDGAGWDGGVQTSKGGSFHLGEHGCSFSGSLYSSIPTEELRPTDERKDAAAWIFHHDFQVKDGGVYFDAPFRVWEYDGQPNS